ncbi:hypothetical protein L249_6262 [Ophiocordyceps polyrhachis-furcata BCC 54312]|uniref:AAA+ ATPase domain-containing protein n=1 Tax=Ophiocordyceps polyrhachis-furcata BCC 54312 TaxID=1330021 RepID=A0A367L157_9HYPO|nr:hypothetical protein L249_6262 [Ophiocordyceps polyrhachis-furcata BCC 54312]
MPRIPSRLFRRAKQQSSHLATLLPACRDIQSARKELRWLREHCNDPRRLAGLCRERGRGVPLQYLLGSQPFNHLDIKCRPGVLIPRSETEAYTCRLAELVLRARRFNSCHRLNVLDLCTGTGCIPLLLFSLLQASFDGLNVLGIDIAREAVKLARENVDRNTKMGYMRRPVSGQSLRFLRRDIFDEEAMRPLANDQWDVLVSNPPYIAPRVWDYGLGQLGSSVRRFEPQLALVPGPHLPIPEGWDRADAFYARLLDLAVLLDPKLFVLELGDEAQARRILAHYLRHPLARSSSIEVWRDWPDLMPGEEECVCIVAGPAGALSIPVKGSGQACSPEYDVTYPTLIVSTLFRQSSQLARQFRLAQQPSFRRGVPVHFASNSLFSRICTSPRPRCFSSQTPGSEDESKPGSRKRRFSNPGAESNKGFNFQSNNQSGEQNGGTDDLLRQPPPLPEGWILLTEKEASKVMHFRNHFHWTDCRILSPAHQMQALRMFGAPSVLRELLQGLNQHERLDEANEARLIWCFKVMSERIARWDLEQAMRIRGQKDADETKNEEEDEAADDESSAGEDGDQPKQRQKKKEEQSSSEDTSDKVRRTTVELVQSVVALLVMLWLVEYMTTPFMEKEITWQEFKTNFLDRGLVYKLIVVNGSTVRVELRPDAVEAMSQMESNGRKTYVFSIGSVESFETKLEEAQDQLDIPSSERIPVSYESGGTMLGSIVMAFGPTLLFIGLILWSQRSMSARGGGGVFNFGKSRAKKFNAESAVKVKFADVAGLEEAKTEIMEFVSFLKQPEKFQKLGAKIPRGAILSGPPGTGKTLLAKATAGESGVPFYSVSGSEFVEMFVGVGPSRVRDLFAEGRKNAPCIIFIDEIDAIGRSRTGNSRFGGNDEREATLNQILTEMDGFNTQEQVVVLAGTNRADILDGALMRPGRFDRHIVIDRPTMNGRKEIFRVYLKKIVTKEDVDMLVGRLAAMTPGFSGADISNVVNEAALIAARNNAEDVKMAHFENAIDRVVGGLERKSLVLKPEEKKTVAYHEAGHAICGWFLKDADPLVKVSIIPRGQGALGYAQYLPQDAYLMNMNQLMDRMAMTMGGRVSEELHFPTVTTGASDDFKKVSHMARNMVTEWGMSEKVGPVHFDNDPNRVHKPFAEATAQQIDQEVHRIVEEAYRRCRELLTEKKKEVGLVAEELLKKEVLVRDDMERLLGKRPFEEEEFEKFFRRGQEKGAPPPPPTETKPPPATAFTGGGEYGR